MAHRASTKPLHSSRIDAAVMTSSHSGSSEVPAVLRSRSYLKPIFVGCFAVNNRVWGRAGFVVRGEDNSSEAFMVLVNGF